MKPVYDLCGAAFALAAATLSFLLAPWPACLPGAAAAETGGAKKPNVVLILVDDLGWTDLGCQGSKYYETPHIDGLAHLGMRFTDAYAACAVCSPTRASVQTGRYPARLGVTDWIRARFQGGVIGPGGKNPGGYVGGRNHRLLCPQNALFMELDEVTLAEALRPAGYVSCHIGKWHLGQAAHFPEKQGYDFNHGGCDLGQPPSYFDPYESKRKFYEIPNLPPRKPGEYLTDREADEAVRFIKAHKDRPFFLNMCHYCVHTPLQAKKDVKAKYEAKPKTNHKNSTYAAMVESVDDSTGRIVQTLNELGIAERTVILFTSDNGGLMGPTDNAPLRSGKGFPYEGGIRVPWIVRWPGVVEPGTTSSVPICTIDIFPTLMQIARVPLPKDRPIDGLSLVPVLKDDPQQRLERMEAVLKAKAMAKVYEQRVAEVREYVDEVERNIAEAKAKLAKIEGDTPEAQAERKKILGVIARNERVKEELERESRIQATSLDKAQTQLDRAQNPLDRDALYWHFPHYRGQLGPYSIVRSGRWKLIKWYQDDEFELFNLADDLGETKDLAKEKPEKVKELDARLTKWLESVGAKMPKPNPDYKGPLSLRERAGVRADSGPLSLRERVGVRGAGRQGRAKRPVKKTADGASDSPHPNPLPGGEGTKRPNVLWIIAEDFSPDLGCYGEKLVHTPNLDRLAAQGVRYTRAFTTAPVCSASRSAFMTGMYQTTIGAHNHRSHRGDGYKLPEGVRVLTEWMRQAGYYTANVRTIGGRRWGTGKTDWNFTPPKPAYDSDRWEALKAHQPFYAQINFSETHRKFKHCPEHPVDPAKVKLPPYYPDHPVAREDWALYLETVNVLDRKVGRVLKQLEDDGLADDTVVIFFGDHGQAMVRGKQWCYDSGLRVPLIVRWPKDYPAPPQITPGKVDDRLIAAIDFAPTTLAIAGAKKPPKMEGRVFLGKTADPPREYVFGARDRCDETVFRIRTVRDARYRYIRNFMPERPFLQLNRYKERSYPMIPLMRKLHAEGKLTPVEEVLMAPHRPAEELYDLEKDPYEIHNLADSPRHQDLLKRLRAALDEWIETTGDQGRTLEGRKIVESWDAKMKANYERKREKPRRKKK